MALPAEALAKAGQCAILKILNKVKKKQLVNFSTKLNV